MNDTNMAYGRIWSSSDNLDEELDRHVLSSSDNLDEKQDKHKHKNQQGKKARRRPVSPDFSENESDNLSIVLRLGLYDRRGRSRQRSRSYDSGSSSDAASLGNPKTWDHVYSWSTKYNPCKHHTNESVEYFCTTHGTTGCGKCMNSDHKGCDHEHIDVATKRFQDEGGVAKLVAKLQGFEREYTASSHCFASVQQSVKATKESAIKDICSFHDMLILRVNEAKASAVGKVNALHTDNEKHNGQTHDELKAIGESLRSLKLEREDQFTGSFIVAMETEALLAELKSRLYDLNIEQIRKYGFLQHKLVADIIGDMTLLGDVYEDTEKQECKASRLDEMEQSLNVERKKISEFENEIKNRDEQILKMTSLLKEVKTLSYADPSKVGVFSTLEGIRVLVFKADILHAEADCIANASNKNLQHTAGVAKAIAKAAGKDFVEECKKYAHKALPVGATCTTTAGKLPYRAIINAVSPIWRDYNIETSAGRKKCEDDLMLTVLHVFCEAEKKGYKSIALPAIGSASAAIPLEICVSQYVRAVRRFSRSQRGGWLGEIHFIDKDKHRVMEIQQAFLEANKTIQPLGFKKV